MEMTMREYRVSYSKGYRPGGFETRFQDLLLRQKKRLVGAICAE
jgi:hypothetical protein